MDEAALRRAARRMRAAGEPAWLHGEIARRMARRLLLLKARPQRVLLWDEALGGGRSELLAAYEGDIWPSAGPRTWRAAWRSIWRPIWRPECVEVLTDEGAPAGNAASPQRAGPAGYAGAGWGSWMQALRRRLHGAQGVRVAAGALPAASAQLLWANMVLHFEADPLHTMRQWQQALTVEGCVMFSTLGPGTLIELQRLHDELGFGPALTPQVDMHDLGDLLLRAGFADPVMDQETLVLSWSDAHAALRELRSLGANAHPRRLAGLRSPRAHARWLRALQSRAGADGRISLSFEIAYGHAFRPPERVRLEGETRIGLQQMRDMVRPASASGKPPAGPR